MWIRRLAMVVALVIGAQTARAEVGIGAFLGEPTGIDVKLDLDRRSAIDLLFGWYSHYNDFDSGTYGHVTYLVQPVVSHGRSVIVPLRIGIGVAVFDDRGRFDNDVNVAVRFPLEVALRFRSSPVEIYGEIAFKVTFVDEHDDHRTLDLDGGIGIRFYF